MPAPRRFDVDELLNRPGTYFNPETEIVLVVDDSAAVESELFSDDAADDAAEWVLVSDETPVDEHQRDALLERFQAGSRPVHGRDDGRASTTRSPRTRRKSSTPTTSRTRTRTS